MMASKQDIKKTIGKLICIRKISVPTLSPEEKDELKMRIQLAIKQLQGGNA